MPTEPTVTYHVVTEAPDRHHVLVRNSASPDWYRRVATFASEGRAREYGNLELILAKDVPQEANEYGDAAPAPDGLPEPPKLKTFADLVQAVLDAIAPKHDPANPNAERDHKICAERATGQSTTQVAMAFKLSKKRVQEIVARGRPKVMPLPQGAQKSDVLSATLDALEKSATASTLLPAAVLKEPQTDDPAQSVADAEHMGSSPSAAVVESMVAKHLASGAAVLAEPTVTPKPPVALRMADRTLVGPIADGPMLTWRGADKVKVWSSARLEWQVSKKDIKAETWQTSATINTYLTRLAQRGVITRTGSDIVILEQAPWPAPAPKSVPITAPMPPKDAPTMTFSQMIDYLRDRGTDIYPAGGGWAMIGNKAKTKTEIRDLVNADKQSKGEALVALA